jgi:NAD(P)-dependent dehydrogenase (short-subunit alcohol dehydrogenase family)
MTAQFAKELGGTPIKVNAVDPGYTVTDLNMRGVEQGAQTVVHLATLPADGPAGRFFDQDGALQPR